MTDPASALAAYVSHRAGFEQDSSHPAARVSGCL